MRTARRVMDGGLALVLTLVLLALPAAAHRLNETYVYFSVTETDLTGRFEATTADLAKVLPLAQDAGGAVPLETLTANGAQIFAFFAERLQLWDGDTALALTPTDIRVLETERGAFAQIGFEVTGLDTVPDEIRIAYRPLADMINPTHLGYGLIENNSRTGITDNEGHIALVFMPGDGPQTLYLSGEPAGQVFSTYVVHGIWHIWKGFDHLIFLVTLLLPSVMWLSGQRWAPLHSFPGAFFNVVKLVTIFTLAQAAALLLAALGIAALPVPLVEVVIAVSLAALALMNMYPAHARWVIWVVVLLGLFHGFGYASVLAPLGAETATRLVGLAGFTLGIELGQLAIVAIAFPVLWLLRSWSLYPPLAFKLGSVALILLAGVWFLERSTGIVWDVRGIVLQSLGIA